MRFRTMLLSAVFCLPFMAGSAMAERVGVTTAVNQSAHGIPPRQQVRTISLGDAIIHDELIKTDSDGLLQILLADGTTFTVGPSSSLKIDSFVYDRDAGSARITATLGKGVFRFIGGQASKTPGGVTLETPVGTVGIRGAIAGFDFRGDRSSFRIDMQYGKEITLKTKDGKKKRLYAQGFSIFFDKNKAFIKKTLEKQISLFEALLSGKLGKNGGAPKGPTNQMVVSSGIGKTNSGVPFSFIPIPTPRPSQDEGDEATGDANRQDMRGAAEKATPVGEGGGDTGSGDTGGDTGSGGTGGDTGSGGTGGDTGSGGTGGDTGSGGTGGDTGSGGTGGDTGSGDTGGGGTVFTEAPLRVLTAQGGSSPSGIVGGTAETDQAVTLKTEDGATEGRAELSGGTVTLPVYYDTTFTTHSDASGVSSSLGTLSGTAYAGPGGFTAYLLGVDGNVEQPFYAITGTPTNVAGVFQGSDVRHYSLTVDPLQGNTIPFTTPAFDFTGAVSSDLLIAETDGIANGSAKVFQSWLTINGAGASQNSAIGVNVGALAGDGSGLALERRGSYRIGGAGTSYALFGAAAALSGAEGGAIFGANGENFVISDDAPGDPGHFHDSPADASGVGADFSTIHVGNLESTSTATRSLAGPYNGFAAGVLDGVTLDSAGTVVASSRILATNDDPGDVTVDFNSSEKSLGGVITVGQPDVEAVTVSFGQGIGGNALNGASAYIDDDTFGAAANPDPSATTDSTGTGGYQQRHDADAGTYFVSSGSVSDLSGMKFMESVAAVNSGSDLDGNGVSDYLCSDCNFLKWGWWGTQAQMADTAGSNPNEEARRLSTHLGTWVIGDIADVAQVDDLSGTTAYYHGLAVGNVVNGADTYVAAGKMDMDYDFGARGGSLSISDFDGHSFGGSMNGAASGKATFSGGLYGSPGMVEGHANGAFVNDGSDIAAGVIGDFSVDDVYGDWSATGIFAGKKYTPSK